MPLQRKATPASPPPKPRKPLKAADRRQMSRDSDVRLYVGGTGSGKTFALRRHLKKWRGRVFVWDWKQEFTEYPLAETIPQLAKMAKSRRCLRYIPSHIPPPPEPGGKKMAARDWIDVQFEYFCRIAWAVQEADPQTDIAFVVEEASEVTRASGAPAWWSRIITQGRVLGFSPIIVGQRPAQIDKATISSADYVRVGRLNYAEDARAMGMMVRRSMQDILDMPKRHAYVIDRGELGEELP